MLMIKLPTRVEHGHSGVTAGKHAQDLLGLASRCELARRWTAAREGLGGEADRAGPYCVVDEGLHGGDLVACGLAFEGILPHNRKAHGRMADERTEVQQRPAALHLCEVSGKSGDGVGHHRVERSEGHVLKVPQHGEDSCAFVRRQWRQRETAVAIHHGCHAMVA